MMNNFKRFRSNLQSKISLPPAMVVNISDQMRNVHKESSQAIPNGSASNPNVMN